jgi:GABA permease
MRHVLVVANQTLGSDELVGTLRRRVADGPCEFHFVVPNTLSTGRRGADPGHLGPPADEDVTELVQRRLDAELNWLRKLGVTVTGEVGSTDPVQAVSAALGSRQDIDEVIVATFPRGTSRWLRMDLVNRVKRHSRLPVTHVECKRPKE